MLWLLWLIPLVGGSRTGSQEVGLRPRSSPAPPLEPRPLISYCRSPNMEDFSCWWRPLDQPAAYVLTYSIDKGPQQECPDYVTSGPHSCHFDSSHTSIWKIYCLQVTAVTPQGNRTSPDYCLDVAEIVETEAPVNLSYSLTDAGGDEMGHNALLSWAYPLPQDLQYGWITLEYELQYRRRAEPDNWKVKHPLREPRVQLLGLRVGDYVVRVRSRSHNYGLWSKWSAPLRMSIPSRPATGKVLVLVLVGGVGVLALLAVAFGVLPHSKRIRDYFLPPIPKPRILGIDPLLLKKGNLEEVSRHFSSFHGYRPPRYSEEVWDPVSSDGVCLTSARDHAPPAGDAPPLPGDPWSAQAPPPNPYGQSPAPYAQSPAPYAQNPAPYPRSYAQNPAPYGQSSAPYARSPAPYGQSPAPYGLSPAPYCASPPKALLPWPGSEVVSVPGTDYSVMEHPGLTGPAPSLTSPAHNLTSPAPAPTGPAPGPARPAQDFYTCVHLLSDSGELHLVPCLPPARRPEAPPPAAPPLKQEAKLQEYRLRRSGGGGEEEEEQGGEAAVPLLPLAVEDAI